MPKNTKSINDNLFRMLRAHGYEPTPLDSSGKKIPVPSEADVFQFKIKTSRIDEYSDAVVGAHDDDEEATITVSIDDNHDLKVYYDNDAAGDDNWYELLARLKNYAVRNTMGFDPTDEDQLTYDMDKREHIKREGITENSMKRDGNYRKQGVAEGYYNDQDEYVSTSRREDPHAYEKHRQAELDDPTPRRTMTDQEKAERAQQLAADIEHIRQKMDRVRAIIASHDRPLRTSKKESVYEMDKSQTPPGRDGDTPGPEKTGKQITKKKATSASLNILQQNMAQQHEKKPRRKVDQLPTRGADYSDYDTDHLKTLLKPGILHRDEARFKKLIRAELRRRGELTEAYHPAGRRNSWSDNIPQVKIAIVHSRPLGEGEARYRNIERIFIENTDGERILVPTTNTAVARTFARLIAEGDKPHSERWGHLVSIMEDYSALRKFTRVASSAALNESATRLLETAQQHCDTLRGTLHTLTTHRGYNRYFESWTPTLLESADERQQQHVLSMLGEGLAAHPHTAAALPALCRLNATISENSSITEVDELEGWADNIIDEALGDGGDEAHSVMQSIVADNDPLQRMRNVMNEPQTPDEEVASQELNSTYERIAGERGLHPDDDDEAIYQAMYDELVDEYGESDDDDTPNDDGLRDTGDERVTEGKLTRGQRSAGQVGATERAKPTGPILGAREKKHPFHDRLVGGAAESVQHGGEMVDEGVRDWAKKAAAAGALGLAGLGAQAHDPGVSDTELRQPSYTQRASTAQQDAPRFTNVRQDAGSGVSTDVQEKISIARENIQKAEDELKFAREHVKNAESERARAQAEARNRGAMTASLSNLGGLLRQLPGSTGQKIGGALQTGTRAATQIAQFTGDPVQQAHALVQQARAEEMEALKTLSAAKNHLGQLRAQHPEAFRPNRE